MAPLVKIIVKIIKAVVEFLEKLDVNNTSVINDTIAKISRIMLNGLIKARRSRYRIVLFFRSENPFFPYFLRISSIWPLDKPSGVVPIALYISLISRYAYFFMRLLNSIVPNTGQVLLYNCNCKYFIILLYKYYVYILAFSCIFYYKN